ncbi:LysR family transcriptional regulator [Alicyclobacillus curvatus]|nr:LysR family transcriptional regulator [Alicyclobacillus curvatus]
MEVHDLELFCRTAELRSISKAAAALRMAQPSVSSRIQKLEAELGVTLFRRTHKGVELTHDGVKFEGYAHRCLELLNEAVTTLKTDAKRQRLRIGAPASVAECMFAPILQSLAHQNIEVWSYTNHSQQILEMVLDGLLEAGFCLAAPSIPGIRFIHLRDIPIYCVCPSDHELSTVPDGSLTLNDIARYPLAMYSWGEGFDDLRQTLMETESRKQSAPLWAKVTPASVAKQLVEQGAISFLPFDLLKDDVEAGRIKILHPSGYPTYTWKLGVAIRERKTYQEELQPLWNTLGIRV